MKKYKNWKIPSISGSGLRCILEYILESEPVLEPGYSRMEQSMGKIATGHVRCKWLVGKRTGRNGIYSGNGCRA